MPDAIVEAPKNKIGFAKTDYQGGPSTLCKGCGHDSITQHIITSFYELGVDPTQVAKMSGIGCSSKTPAYFLNRAHGFNTVHGRMPSVSQGAKLANRKLIMIGVSGDGDTSNIGFGQFSHLMRRNLDMVYIIENNGVYGLTKGQFSATADVGSKLKSGEVNHMDSIDCCAVAIQLGATFVARSFSGDAKQMVPLLKAAISHQGIALLDVVSPCVTFNDHEGSTKSYEHVKKTDSPLHFIDYVEPKPDVQVEYEEGTVVEIEMHDGSKLRLKKLSREYDPTNRGKALEMIEDSHRQGILTTGLLYFSARRKEFCDEMNIVDTALGSLKEADLRPDRPTFDSIISRYK